MEELYKLEELLLDKLSLAEDEYTYWLSQEEELEYDYQSDNGSYVAVDESWEEEVHYELDVAQQNYKDIEDQLDDLHSQMDIVNAMRQQA